MIARIGSWGKAFPIALEIDWIQMASLAA